MACFRNKYVCTDMRNTTALLCVQDSNICAQIHLMLQIRLPNFGVFDNFIFFEILVFKEFKSTLFPVSIDFMSSVTISEQHSTSDIFFEEGFDRASCVLRTSLVPLKS